MSFFGGSKGPSASEIAAQQRQAAERERVKLATETAQKEALEQKEMQQSYAREQSRRQSMVGAAVEDDDTQRRKFLRGV